MTDVNSQGNDAIAEIPLEECLDMRHLVLHPGKSRDFSRVEGDENARHFGIKSNGKFVGCVSVFGSNPSQIRKFATLPEYQGHGYGSKLLLYTMSQITGPIFLDARVTAIGFYEKFGFEQVGLRFFKGDIEHIRMELEIP